MDKIWNEIVRLMDVLMITMQKELIMLIIAVCCLLTGYYIVYPFIRIMIALEWGTFLTFILVSITGIWLMSYLVPEIPGKYYIFAIIIFSLCICSRRLLAIWKVRLNTKQI
ncbi:hypothetical protein SAMN04487944_11464 [Gracilibacillus ureilyticus]|uniref:Uncharacterized protein n=1 Tax=Gracilibacillus ureilyticus TaxID=531814 RepID=A0A1H9TLS2_9BACI|nr:hypothetical protein [Gracilibacillus ureilyticus]SER98072.1 hypothetical protein SAMN04487944_11464 [Gracilibacillus ureilyticus]